MPRAEILSRRREQIRTILARYDVANPRLFGSTARGDDGDASDIDILVDAGQSVGFYELADLESELQALLGCRVDVTTPGGLARDVRARVERDARPLF